MRKRIYIPLIIFIMIALTLNIYFLWQINKNKNSKIDIETPVKSDTDVTNWKSYQNTEAKFSVKYPTNWTLEILSADTNIRSEGIDGPEGKIIFTWGTVAQERCLPDFEKIQLQEEVLNTCHSIENSGIENWQQINKDYGNFTVSVSAIANSPSYKNRDLILLILSNLKFEKVDPTLKWTAYKNELYGFEMKYPPEIQPKEITPEPSPTGVISPTSGDTAKKSSEKEGVSTAFILGDGFLRISYDLPSANQGSNKKPITIAGVQTNLYYSSATSGTTSPIQSPTGHAITLSYFLGKDPEKSKIIGGVIDAMISSFRFIK